MAKLMTKSELIEKVAAAHSELSKKNVIRRPVSVIVGNSISALAAKASTKQH